MPTYHDLHKKEVEHASGFLCSHGSRADRCCSSMCYIWTPEELHEEGTIPAPNSEVTEADMLTHAQWLATHYTVAHGYTPIKKE